MISIRKSLCYILLFLGYNSSAQVEYLRLSPAQKIIQRVGSTDLEINYSRPQLKGRTMFGEMLAFGKLWRTGANENTTISFDHRVQIGNKEINAAQYNLLTRPWEDKWDIYFYTETNHLDIPEPIDSTKLIYLTTVPVINLSDREETLVINIYDITETTANLGISWEYTRVNIPITFYTQEAMEKKINAAFKQNIADYNIAASYYYQRDIELGKAKELKELAMSLKDKTNEWDHHSYGIILHKLGLRDKAINNLKQSLSMATKSQNTYLIEENKKLLEEIEN